MLSIHSLYDDLMHMSCSRNTQGCAVRRSCWFLLWPALVAGGCNLKGLQLENVTSAGVRPSESGIAARFPRRVPDGCLGRFG
jgi:hypothetical protein